MGLLLYLLSTAIQIYIWIVILYVVIQWLVAFQVLNLRTQQARNLVNLLQRAVDPVMKRVQKYIPLIGGIDLSPIVVIIGLQLIEQFIYRLFT